MLVEIIGGGLTLDSDSIVCFDNLLSFRSSIKVLNPNLSNKKTTPHWIVLSKCEMAICPNTVSRTDH